ncbi:MAG: TolC family protein [Candidatus Omnitrophota bacterium]
MKKFLHFILLISVFGMLLSDVTFSEEIKEKRMSLKDAIYYGLKNNLDLQIQRSYTLEANENVKVARGVFIPAFKALLTNSETNSPATDFLAGAEITQNKTFRVSAGVSQFLPTNGTLSFTLGGIRYRTNSYFYNANPSLSSEGRLALSQPLLKGFGSLAANYQIYIASNNSKINKFLLKESVISLVFNVESAYWELVYAGQNLEAARMALERAKDLLHQNEIKMKVGTIGAIDVLSSKAGVARNESNVISAEQYLQSTQENLKRILNLSKETFTIVPSDTPEINTVPLDYDSFVKEAMDNRTDVARAKLALDNSNIDVRYNRNQMLPSLQLEASYFTTGQGGDMYIYRPDTSPFSPDFNPDTDIIGVIKKSLGDTFKDVFKNLYRNYSISLNLAVPLSFAVEKANYRIAKIGMSRAQLNLQSVENTVYYEVKDVLKEVQSNLKLVEADRIAMELEGENLRAEEKKLSVGLSTNFTVLTYQQQYAQAQTQALRSTIRYMVSLARINKVLNRTFNAYNIKFDDVLNTK